jgi:polyisoprenoid-binding protein YceI
MAAYPRLLRPHTVRCINPRSVPVLKSVGLGLVVSLQLALMFGAAQAQAVADPARVQAGTYALEPVHTQVLYSLSHMGFTTWYGNFTGASGTLVIDPKSPANSTLSVSIPAASLSSTSAKLDGELKGSGWFGVADYPTITFKSTKVDQTGPTAAQVTGDLTLHGETHPVTLAVTFNGAGVNPLDRADTLGFEAIGRIKRSAFGIRKYVPLVGDDVNLIISAAFEKK